MSGKARVLTRETRAIRKVSSLSGARAAVALRGKDCRRFRYSDEQTENDQQLLTKQWPECRIVCNVMFGLFGLAELGYGYAEHGQAHRRDDGQR